MANGSGDRLLITNGAVFTLGGANQMVAPGAVCVEGDHIVAVGAAGDLENQFRGVPRLDAAGKLILPGSICAHTHFYGAFARGMALPGPAPTTFTEILSGLWWKLDKALLPDEIRLSALVCLVEAIRHGTTTLVDHHASPNAIDGSLDVIADAVTQAGVRASLCYEVTDRNGKPGAEAGIRENSRFIERCQRSPHPLLGASFGIHASLTVSPATLEHCASEAAGLGSGCHIHVAEGAADQEDSLRRYNVRVVERLQASGILGPKTVAAHCVHLDAFEKDILRETRTIVAHQPRSNMNNAVGITDTVGLHKRGVTIALGNDGFTNDLFAEMKAAYFAPRQAKGDPQAIGGDLVMDMAYAGNAHAARLFFPAVGEATRPLGELSVGALADLILMDYDPPTPLSAGNLPYHMIFGLDGGYVTHTMVGGRWLMKDRQLTTLDEAEISAQARAAAHTVWRRLDALNA